MRPQFGRDAALADAGLADQQHRLAVARPCARPALQQQRGFCVAVDQRREPGAVCGGEAAVGAACAQHAPHANGLGNAFERVFAAVFALEGVGHQAACGGSDEDLVGLGQRLHTRGDVGRGADRGLGQGRIATAGFAHHDGAGGDADANAQRPHCGHGLDGVDDLQRGQQGPLGRVFVGAWPAEVHHQSVTQVLRHVSGVAFHRSTADLLVALHQRAQVFGVELMRQRGGTHQVAEHDRQLAPLGARHHGGHGHHGRGKIDLQGLRWRRGDGGDGTQQLEPVPQHAHAEQIQFGVAKGRQQLEFDCMALETLAVLLQAQAQQPLVNALRRFGAHR